MQNYQNTGMVELNVHVHLHVYLQILHVYINIM